MTPTLQPGDRVLVLRYWPAAWLRRGQIVIIWPWQSSQADSEELPYIKRIIGMPGDTLVTSLGALDDFNRERERVYHDAAGQRTWHIPPRHIFVRGDHPIGGFDSLSWGPIHFRCVLGVAVMKLARSSIYQPRLENPRWLALIGRPAPAFTALTLQGETVTQKNYLGRSVAFIFTAAGCTPCQEALVHIKDLYPQAKRAGVELVLVNVGGESETSEFPPELPRLIAPQEQNTFMKHYQVPGIPAYCFIDPLGKVQSIGFPTRQFPDWKALVEAWEAGEASPMLNEIKENFLTG